jgi:ribosomal protein L11
LNAFLLKVPEFHKRIAEVLLDFIDRVNIAVTIAARSSFQKALHEVSKPSVTSLLIHAKIQTTGDVPSFDQHTEISFATVARNEEYGSLGRERLTKCIDN